MGFKLVYEALEIEKLLDEEKAARDKGPIAEKTLEDEQVEEVVEKKKEEADEETESSLDTPEQTVDAASEEDPDLTSTDPEAPSGGIDEEVATGQEDGNPSGDTGEEPVQESLRDNGDFQLSAEAFDSPHFSALHKTVELLKSNVVELSELTAQTSSKILGSMYKGVVYGMARVNLTVGKIYAATDKSKQRQKSSIEMLRKRLDALKQILNAAGSKTEGVEDLAITYGNKGVIAALVCGANVDVIENLQVLDDFLSSTQPSLHKAILNDFEAIRYYGTVFTHGKGMDHRELAKPITPPGGFVKGSLPGHTPESDLLQAYHSEANLPGNMAVIMELPADGLDTMGRYTTAYSFSRMYLGFNKEAYQSVDELKILGLKKVKDIANALEKLITTCEKQQTLYEDISRTKTGVMLSIKRHAMNLVESTTKVRYADSLVEPMYLKADFIAKVYLVGSLDIYDYAAKTISNGLSLAEELAKKYS